ncbi:type II toxin-antitoxin system ParD family antitoxin [Chelativorans sp. ZYF759]|uniref:type II toxin-antitoxin system ParD family antitoxin n=1 Tax=Chelativorans sp. ZYF759 TaxID=2692213 RepID=UPI00145E7D04|nr:type II toxin-antitoxin system ParD family antitoxin [Chelativorans sp. ZYF759]NMG39540.1 type II toxin-antitoxin system ParD family antitoxin [Chelativorans sp. ZYF759]
MNKIDRRTISLPAEQGDYIDRLVQSGEYGSASEVVRAGIRALQQHDKAIEHWLRTEVAETYDRMVADPSRGIPIEEVRAEFVERSKKRREGGL